jgi:hypothetical protein
METNSSTEAKIDQIPPEQKIRLLDAIQPRVVREDANQMSPAEVEIYVSDIINKLQEQPSIPDKDFIYLTKLELAGKLTADQSTRLNKALYQAKEKIPAPDKEVQAIMRQYNYSQAEQMTPAEVEEYIEYIMKHFNSIGRLTENDIAVLIQLEKANKLTEDQQKLIGTEINKATKRIKDIEKETN